MKHENLICLKLLCSVSMTIKTLKVLILLNPYIFQYTVPFFYRIRLNNNLYFVFYL